ncbi:MAG: GspH/FimT family pseudopilin [Myxococcota bacterium]
MRRTERGFTLLELVTVVAIATVLATLGVGSLQNFIWRQRVNTVTRQFYSAIATARSEAIRRSQTVVVQYLSSTDVPVDEAGIYSFVDANDNFIYDPGSDETVYSYVINQDQGLLGSGNYSETISVTTPFGGSGFTDQDFLGSSIPRSIMFNAQGFSFTFGSSDPNDEILHGVTFDINDLENTSERRRIEITVAGAARVSNP